MALPSIVNKLTSAIGSGNSGFPITKYPLDVLQGYILVPQGWKIPAASLISATAALDFLQEAIYQGRASRIFPIGPIQEFEPQNTDRQQETSNLGFVRTTQDGKTGFRFGFWNGGLEYWKSISAFDGTDMNVLLVDKKGTIIGTYVKNATDEKEIYGLSQTDYAVSPFNWAVGSTGPKFFTDIQLADDTELSSAAAAINLGVSVFSVLNGLVDVELVDAESSTTGVIHVKIVADGGNTDIYDTHADALAVSGAWDIKDHADGTTPVVVASVAKVPAKKAWALTLTTPPAAVDATLKDTVTLNGLTIPVAGIEAENTIVITVL